MAVRKVIRIDEEKCDGCGLCVPSCAEGAIQIIDGKAKLVSETYCDGLGACLGDCPQGAITLEEREAARFDESAVHQHLSRKSAERAELPLHAGPSCPGSALRSLTPAAAPARADATDQQSTLSHWPVQLMLVPPHAPFLHGADILICADCVPFTVPDFHSRYLAGKAVLVGCPKLDNLEFYAEKLKAIFSAAGPASVTVLRMEVPCCGGIADIALRARNEVSPQVPIEVRTIGIRGETVDLWATSRAFAQ